MNIDRVLPACGFRNFFYKKLRVKKVYQFKLTTSLMNFIDNLINILGITSIVILGFLLILVRFLVLGHAVKRSVIPSLVFILFLTFAAFNKAFNWGVNEEVEYYILVVILILYFIYEFNLFKLFFRKKGTN